LKNLHSVAVNLKTEFLYLMKSKLYILFLAALLFGCSSDENDKNPSLGTMTFSITGVSSNMEINIATLQKRTETDSKGDHILFTMLVHGKDEFSTLDFNALVWDWQNPPVNGVPVKDYSFDWQGPDQECTDTNSACDGAQVIYSLNSKVFSADQNNLGNSYAKITKCDPVQKLVSGEFFVLVKELGGVETQQLTGSFTNIKYTIE
jgi:hypothetical protein